MSRPAPTASPRDGLPPDPRIPSARWWQSCASRRVSRVFPSRWAWSPEFCSLSRCRTRGLSPGGSACPSWTPGHFPSGTPRVQPPAVQGGFLPSPGHQTSNPHPGLREHGATAPPSHGGTSLLPAAPGGEWGRPVMGTGSKWAVSRPVSLSWKFMQL